MHRALDAAAALAKEGIEAEVIDLRTLSPLDIDTVLESVENTGHLVVVDEASPRCNIATDISAQVAQQIFKALKGPSKWSRRRTCRAVLSGARDLYIPSSAQIAEAARRTVGYANGKSKGGNR